MGRFRIIYFIIGFWSDNSLYSINDRTNIKDFIYNLATIHGVISSYRLAFFLIAALDFESVFLDDLDKELAAPL